jgi:hypothetical protein
MEPKGFMGYFKSGNACEFSSFGHMEPKGFMRYLERGSACELNSFGHEQYPSDSLNQNN